jgi:hypothetical protein
MKIGGLRVDTQEVHGPFCKVVRIKEFPDLIFNGKFRGPSPRCGGPRTPPRRRLTGEQPEWRPRARNLAAVEEKGGGNGSEPHRLQEGAAKGRKWSGDGGEQLAEEAVGEVGIANLERANEGGVCVVMAGGCSSPFYSGRGGARRGEGGETTGGNGLNTIDGGAA